MIPAPEEVTKRPDMSLYPSFIQMLRPKATLWGAVHGLGSWAVSFPARRDLLFFRVDQGRCLLVRPSAEPLPFNAGDLLVLRTSAATVLASDIDVTPVDSEQLIARTRRKSMHVGEGAGEPTVVRGGRFVFDPVNEELLLDLMPTIMHVTADDPWSARMQALLGMAEAEARTPGLASDFVTARLVELLLVEMLRIGPLVTPAQQAGGLVAGLANPIIARAFAAMHGDLSRPWTVAGLARLCGCSRSAFSQRFVEVVGLAPLTYLRRWRMAVARDELRRGERSIAEIAFMVGFQSGSAFSTAFTHAVGCSPTHFAKYARGEVSLGGVDEVPDPEAG